MRSLLIKLFIRLISFLPLSLAQRIGVLLGLCFYVLPTRLRHCTRVNIDLCWPELDAQQKELLIKNSLIHTGMTVMETGAMLCWPQQRIMSLIQSVSGEEHLKQAIERDKGVILLTPHLGCWEIAGLYVGHHHPATFLYKPPKIKALAAWLKAARQRSGAKLVATNELGPRHLLRVLTKEHGVIGLLPDQEPPEGKGIFCPFFGIEANTMTLAVKLAQKTGAAIIFGFAERLAKGRGYRLFAIAADKAIYDADLRNAVTAMNQTIEQGIRQVPEQYQWGYKRFRKRPDGAKNPYDKP